MDPKPGQIKISWRVGLGVGILYNFFGDSNVQLATITTKLDNLGCLFQLQLSLIYCFICFLAL